MNLIHKNYKGKILKHETKKHSLFKFLLLLFVLASYLAFTVYKFGAENGLLITLLSWSFFVLCTPIADAGFLLDFPVRLITGIRMMYSEIIVWIFAISLNAATALYNPSLYSNTLLLNLFYNILSTPFPYWGIILLSCTGTFFSIYFGDELMDVAFHKQRKLYHAYANKYRVVLFAFVIALTFVLYEFLLRQLGVNIPLL